MMDPETERQFKEFDEWLKTAEVQITLDALNESHARLYGSMQELFEGQKKTDQRLAELAMTMRAIAEAQKRTEESLRRFIDRSGNGHGS